MQKIVPGLCIVLLLATGWGCERTGLKRYYTHISPEEFDSYKPRILKSQSKYGNVYHVTEQETGLHHSKLDYLVLEKLEDGKRTGLFKMDEMVQLKNDSTFIIYAAPLQMVADTENWERGIWFYSSNYNGGTNYSVDSIPKGLPASAYQNLGTGIYQYQNGKVVKRSSLQSEDAFNTLNAQGFFFLPNPGRFYQLADINQIK